MDSGSPSLLDQDFSPLSFDPSQGSLLGLIISTLELDPLGPIQPGEVSTWIDMALSNFGSCFRLATVFVGKFI